MVLGMISRSSTFQSTETLVMLSYADSQFNRNFKFAGCTLTVLLVKSRCKISRHWLYTSKSQPWLPCTWVTAELPYVAACSSSPSCLDHRCKPRLTHPFPSLSVAAGSGRPSSVQATTDCHCFHPVSRSIMWPKSRGHLSKPQLLIVGETSWLLPPLLPSR